jgi:hypothetical protein
MTRQQQIEWARSTVAGEDYLPWADVEEAKRILVAHENNEPDAADIIAALLNVLHPGVVGLIGNNHGIDRLNEACQAVTNARNFLAVSH